MSEYTDWIKSMVSLAGYHRGEVERCRKALERAEAFAVTTAKLLEAAQADACANCGGQGKVWHHYAQDDCKLETCSLCNGEGKLPEGIRSGDDE